MLFFHLYLEINKSGALDFVKPLRTSLP